MSRVFLLSVFLLFASFSIKAQEVLEVKKDTTNHLEKNTFLKKDKPDTTAKPKYVNLGRIAGRKALWRSAIVPGMGQIRSGLTVYRGLKVAGIYTGATLLTLSYIDNNKLYHVFLKELTYRAQNPGKTENELYASYGTPGLIQAKDVYRRNKDVIVFSLIGLYLLNVVEAYIDARLQYFDVSDVAIKISPTLINSGTNTMYGFAPTPGLKLSLAF